MHWDYHGRIRCPNLTEIQPPLQSFENLSHRQQAVADHNDEVWDFEPEQNSKNSDVEPRNNNRVLNFILSFNLQHITNLFKHSLPLSAFPLFPETKHWSTLDSASTAISVRSVKAKQWWQKSKQDACSGTEAPGILREHIQRVKNAQKGASSHIAQSAQEKPFLQREMVAGALTGPLHASTWICVVKSRSSQHCFWILEPLLSAPQIVFCSRTSLKGNVNVAS